MQDRRRISEEATHNRRHLLGVLKRALRGGGLVLEIGSGSGEHAVYFAGRHPKLLWQPSDPDPIQRASIEDWISHEKIKNVRPPLDLEAAGPWPVDAVDAVFSVHTLHLIGAPAMERMIAESARVLRGPGPLILHGPFLRDGRAPSPRMAEFDARLKARGAPGLIAEEALLSAANAQGLKPAEILRFEEDLVSFVLRRSG
ncbi:MAG: DUF938 domain-containing protein [Myxococcota bacterium]